MKGPIHITVELEDTIRRWIREGYTDDLDQVDDYGKRLLRAVLQTAGCYDIPSGGSEPGPEDR